MTSDDPRRGGTARGGARSPVAAAALGAVSSAVTRLGLAELLIRGVIGARRLWAPTWRTRAFAGYTPTRHDALVCTYSKSGTNLALQMIHQIAHLGAGDFEHIHDVAPWPDSPHPTGADLRDGGWVRSPVGLRAIKTHLDAPHVPFVGVARYLVVLRSPRDVFTSAYHFAHGVANTMIDVRLPPEEWFELALRDRTPFGSWSTHVASWWKRRGHANVLTLSYAGITRDLDAAVTRVAGFLGVSLGDDARARVVERCGFAFMKAHDAAFRPPFQPLGGRAPAVMIRSGKSGQGAGLVDEAVLQRIDDHHRRALVRLGCDLPFDRLLAGAPLADDPV